MIVHSAGPAAKPARATLRRYDRAGHAHPAQRGFPLEIHPLRIIGCHECDALVVEPFVPDGGAAYCDRCGGLLFRRHSTTIEICFALVVAAAILFVVANLYPFLAFQMQGQTTQTTLASGTRALLDQGENAVAALVFLTTIVTCR